MRESHICQLPNKALILSKSLSFCNEVIWSIAVGASTGVDNKGFEGLISRLYYKSKGLQVDKLQIQSSLD